MSRSVASLHICHYIKSWPGTSQKRFNVNKDTEVEYLEEDSLVALRLVYDTIVSRDDTDIVSMEISSDLSLSYQLAHKKYEEYLESK